MSTKKVILLSAATFAAGQLLLAFPLILFLILWFGSGWWAVKNLNDEVRGYSKLDVVDFFFIAGGLIFFLTSFFIALSENCFKEYTEKVFLLDKLSFEFQSPLKKKDD